MKVIVIGNGMVGHRFCEEMREAAPEADILVFGEEKHPAYDRVHLSEAFAGKTAEDLSLGGMEWYTTRGIGLVLADAVVTIDTIEKTVTSASGRIESWDRLVLATGSIPFVPPLPGIELDGVYTYRTLEDLDLIREQAKHSKRGIVVGGGLLGLEAAKALRDLGLEATVLEFAPRLMPRQLDDTASLFLKRSIESMGVKVRTGVASKRILGCDFVRGIELTDGEEIPAEMVVFSAGIRPRDDLAKRSGIKVHERGGIEVDDLLRTSVEGVYAIGECALHKGMIHGLVAPGYRMAQTVAKHIADGEEAPFAGGFAPTKLKLMGVDVGSIGDPFLAGDDYEEVVVQSRCRGVYKKLVIHTPSNTLKGAILVGDNEPFNALAGLVQSGAFLPEIPETLLVPMTESVGGGDADSMPICNCENITRGTLHAAIDAGCDTIAALKKATRAGTGCGSCVPLMEQTLKKRLASQGVAVHNHLCEHFKYSRTELHDLIKAANIHSFPELLERYGNGHGCEICKPTAANIFASVWNGHVLDKGRFSLQDSNDKFLANIQKNGTYSVVPRIPGGEITPQKLKIIAEVGIKYDLYTKVTGGQRIDLFGARLDDLPAIWTELIHAGFESGHAYAKSVRTVKSCVGNTWCRFGVQDSVGLAIVLEERYKGIRAPHKIKMAVSGCARECAEAQSKDVGVIATENGYNLFVCGNGGMTPRHASLLATDLSSSEVLKIVDRFMMYYIRTADRLVRTSRWIEELPGGLEHLKDVLLNDSLGLCSEFESEMEGLVSSYQCEWKTALETPELLKSFRTFANSDVPDPSIVTRTVRDQRVPA
ncbi:MAG: nitrite reductase large subunit [Fibrobacterota bacterium]|jgi:nitrite reductase (NADH) large subunit